MRGLGRRRISDGPRGGGPRSGTAAAPVGSTRPSDPMRIGRRSFIRRAVPRAMVALSNFERPYLGQIAVTRAEN